MRYSKKLSSLFGVLLFTTLLQAQNVGIGLTNPNDNLQIHSTTTTSGLSFTNQSVGTSPSAGFRVGLMHDPNNSFSRYGFLYVPSNLPFYIWQGINRRLTINATGAVGIGTEPIAGTTLTIQGQTIAVPGNGQPAFIEAADTSATSGLPAGLGIQKRTASGRHFATMSLRESRAQFLLDANFRNGLPQESTFQLLIDSMARMGIGQNLTSKTLASTLHVFGNQRIEGNGGAVLELHGEQGNGLNSESQLRLRYTPFGRLVESIFPGGADHYFFKLKPQSNDSTSRALTIGFQTEAYLIQGISVPARDFLALSHNLDHQVGIRRYPDRSLNDSIDVDVLGNTRITGKLVLASTGVPSGSILITNASGVAQLQRPSTLTIDQPSATGLSSLEFRNNGTYRGAIGWSQSDGRFFFFDGESGTNTFFVNNGRFGIQRDATTNALEVNGNASKSSAGDWLANSDARLKKNIVPLRGALQQLLQLQGITYEWNDQQTGITRPEGKHYGFTAQNVQAVFPELVSTDAQGYLQTAYGTYDALMLEAIRELHEKIQTLEKEIQQLKSKQP